ncbi:hypothetical protein SLA2020_145080 [Shorea laevis]
MAKLTIAAVILVLAATMSLTEAQNSESCTSYLTDCAPFLNSSTTPDNKCCSGIRYAANYYLNCLCKLYKDPSVLESFNTSLQAALQLAGNCSANNSLSSCATAPAPSPTSVAPPPGNDSLSLLLIPLFLLLHVYV